MAGPSASGIGIPEAAPTAPAAAPRLPLLTSFIAAPTWLPCPMTR
jgi:hypothetical protein